MFSLSLSAIETFGCHLTPNTTNLAKTKIPPHRLIIVGPLVTFIHIGYTEHLCEQHAVSIKIVKVLGTTVTSHGKSNVKES